MTAPRAQPLLHSGPGDNSTYTEIRRDARLSGNDDGGGENKARNVPAEEGVPARIQPSLGTASVRGVGTGRPPTGGGPTGGWGLRDPAGHRPGSAVDPAETQF